MRAEEPGRRDPVAELRALGLGGVRVLEDLPDVELLDLVRRAEEAGRVVDAARTVLAGEVARRSRPSLGEERLCRRFGCRTAGELVQRLTGISGRSARARIRQGLPLVGEVSLTGEPLAPRFPEVSRAVMDGRIGIDAALAVTDALRPALRRGADPGDVGVAERELVASASSPVSTPGGSPLSPDAGDEGGAPQDGGDTAVAPGGTVPGPGPAVSGEGGPDGVFGEDAAPDGSSTDDAAPQVPGEDDCATDDAAPQGPGPDVLVGRVAEDATVLVPRGDPEVPRVATIGGAGADEVAVMARVWASYLDPDGAEPRDAQGMRLRGLTLGREYRGTVSLSGSLLPEVAAQLQRLLDAYTNPRVGSPDPSGSGSGSGEGSCACEECTDTPVDATSDAGGERCGACDGGICRCGQARRVEDLRSATQRRHDAFAGILSLAAAQEAAPRLGATAPTLVVTVDAQDLADPDGRAYLQAVSGEDAEVPAAVARQVACSGVTQVVSWDRQGRVTGLSSPTRVFTAHQRRAIALRDGGCVIPGCDVLDTWCEVHHVRPHAQGGPTHTDNGVLLCWFHHRTIESSGWGIHMVGGVPWVTPPRWVDPDQRSRPARGSRHRLSRGMRRPRRTQHRGDAPDPGDSDSDSAAA